MTDPAVPLLGALLAKRDGVVYARHAILTCGGTWAPDGVGYATDTVNRADNDLCYEVVVPGPQSFGPIPPGSPTAPSYQQSVQMQYQSGLGIIGALINTRQTFGVWGYSQGAQVASMLAMACMTGQFAGTPYFIGGGTYGNPYRLLGSIAPGYTDPGGHGIAPVNMTAADIKYVNGQLCWADYANPKDLYCTSPAGAVGVIEADAYTAATAVQFNDFLGMVNAEIQACLKIVSDALGGTSLAGGLGGLLSGGPLALLSLGTATLLPLLGSIVSGGGSSSSSSSSATGVMAAAEAALNGLEFIAMSPPTAPHISYEGENGYPDAVGMGADFLNHICTLTTATAAS